MSPKFSKFHGIMDVWGTHLENECKAAVKVLMNSGSFVFFFEFEKEIFGGSEDTRIVFATLKNPPKEMPKGWKEEASFMGVNLTTMSKEGNPTRRTFYNKDIKKINILEKKEAENKLNV
jgi:hypothetical protein